MQIRPSWTAPDPLTMQELFPDRRRDGRLMRPPCAAHRPSAREVDDAPNLLDYDIAAEEERAVCRLRVRKDECRRGTH